MTKGPVPRPLVERFWSKVDQTGECWLWMSRTFPNGYGQFAFKAPSGIWKGCQAHRMAFELAHGVIPEGLCVLHTCDRPLCVRPEHLFLGTLSDNTRDMVRKGRDGRRTHPERFARGERIGNSRLTAAQVTAIRAEHRPRKKRGIGTTADLARRYGLCRSTIQRIANGNGWKHLLGVVALFLVSSIPVGAEERIYDSSDTLAAIDAASLETGVSRAWIYRTISCETGTTFDPRAVGHRGELGAAQLAPWGELRRFYQWGNDNPFDPYQSITFMAHRFAQGGSGAWSCS